MNKLKTFEQADIEFIVITEINGELDLELGEDYIVTLDDFSDYEILEWAEENEILDDENFLLEDGSPDIIAIRNFKIEADTEEYWDNPPTYASPSGRAYQWFVNLNFDLPDVINLIDSHHPMGHGYGVTVNNKESLILIQQFLEENSVKVNFKFN